MLLKWDPALNTGVQSIDTQHQELYARLNRLMEAASQGRGRAEIADTIEYLQDYVVTHFRAEEGHMLTARYPEHLAHKRMHDEFVADFLRFKEQFAAEGASALLFIQIQRRIVDWVRNHIAQEDKRFAQFLHGVR
jgi:hemerythrin